MKILTIIATLFLSTSVFSVSDKKGLDIAKKAELQNQGYISEVASMVMTLKSSSGSEVKRELESKTIEINKDETRALLDFQSPKDIKGTKLLTWATRSGDDPQWLYLPSLRRVKRISSSGKSASFMGSEFTYEDLSDQKVDKYHFKYISTAKNKNVGTINILERRSKDDSFYSKVKVYLSEKLAQPIKVEYFDKKGSLLKVATMNGFKAYNVGKNKFYRYNKIHMVNVQTKKESSFEWKSRTLGKKLSTSNFTKRALK
jgi:hypothetical protein